MPREVILIKRTGHSPGLWRHRTHTGRIFACLLLLTAPPAMAEVPEDSPALPNANPTISLSLSPPEAPSIREVGPTFVALGPPNGHNAFGTPCTPIFAADPLAHLGMVDVTIHAPCGEANEVRLSWSGLTVAWVLPPSGERILRIPALATNLHIHAAFSDGRRQNIQIDVPFSGRFLHSGISWKGTQHWDMVANGAGRGGLLYSLGDPEVSRPEMALFFTLPVHTAEQNELVRLALQQRQSENCRPEPAEHTEIQRVETNRQGVIALTPMVLPGPLCHESNPVLVLNNPLRDLKLRGE